MIEASFDRSSRMSAVSGVYQYDTGQRLRMHGLPSPDELLAGDDLFSGTGVTVQVHFSNEGDSQTEMRLAQWNDDRLFWVVDIPDEYLTRIDPVHVYVYVYHGENGDSSRARTEYEGVFSPISRPTPNNVASEDMLSQWANLEAEVDLVLSSVHTSITNAKTYAASAKNAAEDADESAKDAQDAAQSANAATQRLEGIERMWDGVTVQTVDLPAGSAAYAKLEDGALIYGLPRGADGQKGETGDTGPADITLSFADGVLTITPK
ncbi:MAG: hypothetical protein IJD60_07570 [Clostridia bacterium]|nr:hypothetical protein [Clostridia bacterium]